MSMPQPSPRPSWDEALYQRRQTISVALLVVGGLLLAEVLYLFLRFRWDYAPIWSGSFLFGLGAVGAGLWLRQEMVGGLGGRATTRLLVGLLGGLLGFSLAVGGIWQTVYWWKDVTGGTTAWQGEQGWHLIVLGLAALGGLAVMFSSLLLAQAEEARVDGIGAGEGRVVKTENQLGGLIEDPDLVRIRILNKAG